MLCGGKTRNESALSSQVNLLEERASRLDKADAGTPAKRLTGVQFGGFFMTVQCGTTLFAVRNYTRAELIACESFWRPGIANRSRTRGRYLVLRTSNSCNPARQRRFCSGVPMVMRTHSPS